jgi:hypothetical protein
MTVPSVFWRTVYVAMSRNCGRRFGDQDLAPLRAQSRVQP